MNKRLKNVKLNDIGQLELRDVRSNDEYMLDKPK